MSARSQVCSSPSRSVARSAPRVFDHPLLARRGGLQQALDVQLTGDLQVQRRLHHVGGFHDPRQPAVVLAGAVAADVGQRRLIAQRLQHQDRRLRGPERIMRARGDDQRQALLVRLPDRGPDDVVPLQLRAGPDEGLLQAVREHDDLPVLAQPPPDGLALGRVEHVLVDLAQEAVPRQVLEVQLGPAVPQPDRHRDRALVGQELRQPDQHRGLSRAHATDQHVRARPAFVQVGHQHLAQLVAAHHLVEDRPRRRHQLAGLVARPGLVSPQQPVEPPQHEGGGERDQQARGREVGQGPAGEAEVHAPAVEVDPVMRRRPVDQHVQGPGQPEQERERGEDGERGQDPDQRPRPPPAGLVNAAPVPAAGTGGAEPARGFRGGRASAPSGQAVGHGSLPQPPPVWHRARPSRDPGRGRRRDPAASPAGRFR